MPMAGLMLTWQSRTGDFNPSCRSLLAALPQDLMTE
jgi:hypothetical protein